MTNRKLRKQGAKMIEDELFTVQTELDNLAIDLKAVKFRELKTLSYDRLKAIRENLQRIQQCVQVTNRLLATVSEKKWCDTSYEEEGHQTVLLNNHTAIQLLKQQNINN